ncbi:SpoV family signaling peptide [Streptococcus pyogenes]|uniref:SpoV family signaling peptide n=1 Tax=Streptococcus pyogenes TaxID=1314 RepID=UPI00109D7D41|nr:SpoV family signaling peptide [Streptococcus pyogenes]QCK51843.1 hypothetical protein ETT57_00970 [Streptococcus pyogenes]VGS15137.1 Uncharacterised protein [Streptococcus pyogenes]VGS78000.1 Uncharacterised protein [Streptococcus pyogenes]VGW45328.1 Uncharacterised protein [Streptococcus pyogenes]VGW45402.1 Uncharacterised protein [Streptococcus pyogenes]
MKNKLFLVALATVTVLGPSLATPHHQTVHAIEYCIHGSDNSRVSLCYEKEDDIQIEEKTVKNSDPSFFTWLWTKIKTWFSSLYGIWE